MGSLRVYEVGPSDLGRFLHLTEELQGGEPGWVPPLEASLRNELAGAAAFLSYGQQQLFLAERDGRPVGRVAALINPRLLDPSGAVQGQLGYFECVEDPQVAGALFEAGFEWLRARGARSVLGPINGGAHRSHRLMVRGFETSPFLFEPRNPRWYPALFEAHRFQPVHRWFTFELDRAGIRHLLEVMRKVGAPAEGYRVELPDPRQPGPLLARLLPLLDGVWAGHAGYASIELPELAEVLGGLLSLMDPGHLGIVVDPDGADAGAGFFYPDWIDAVRALGGDVSGWGRWMSGTRPRRAVYHTMAVLPHVRRTGAAYKLTGTVGQQLEEHFDEVLIALVTESLKSAWQFAHPSREYALFGRAL
jgi:hypothetical protein